MLMLPPSVRIYAAAQPVDMRKSFDGLSAMVRHQFGQDPLSGCLFVFFNRPRDRVKLLWWDRGGYWLLAKRLERGSFSGSWHSQPDGRTQELAAGDLLLVLEGIDLRQVRRRKRWQPHGS
jgi:transposase